jgi:pyridoxamine 5'-phosphate oxidase
MSLTNEQIAALRVDYALASFEESNAHPNPFDQFKVWFKEALDAQVNEPNAMTLATVKPNGTPSARIVLLKAIEGNTFSFYTNQQSDKASQLEFQPNIALVFCWLELQRQVRIEGVVTKTTDAEAEAYFETRPRKSQLGAWASPQSQVIASRMELEQRFAETTLQFENQPVPKPPHWGGYAVTPHYIEFWQGRQSRLHDRLAYTLENGVWKISRLAP